VAQWRRSRRGDRAGGEANHGTVGAVARDRRGFLAAATSTGGLLDQLPGRVGDSPVIGTGTWASRVCAVSATGAGDVFARVAFARRAADLIELAGLSPEEAGAGALEEVRRAGGRGGCIILDAAGRLAFPFTSPHMLRGWFVDRDPPVVSILPDERVVLSGFES
jgi:isoaspartyl peptidase/L-asparaginase-like protein (Ntn-hydrolase superfamily)